MPAPPTPRDEDGPPGEPAENTLALFGRKDKDGSEGFSSLVQPPGAGIDPAPTPASAGAGASATTVASGLCVKGEMAGEEDVTVDGRIEGIVSLAGELLVTEDGVVEADVRARSVVVRGRVLGNVIAEEKVEIYPSGELEGNIRCPKISIHEGAQFKGNVDMRAAGAEATDTAAVPPDGD